MDRPALTPFLFDRAYWSGRLAGLDRTDPHLRRTPLDGACGADRRATELWFRALDGSRLRALLIEPHGAPGGSGLSVVVTARARPEPGAALPSAAADGAPGAPTTDPDSPWPDLPELAARSGGGRALLLATLDPGRRLEDRVLDLVRAVDAARASGGDALDGPVEIEGEDDAARIGSQVLEMRRRV